MTFANTVPSSPTISLEVIQPSVAGGNVGIVRFFKDGLLAGYIEIEGASDQWMQLRNVLLRSGFDSSDAYARTWLATTPKDQAREAVMPWILNFIARIVAKINALLDKDPPAEIPSGSTEFYESPLDLFTDIVKRIKWTVNADGSISGSL